MGYGNLSCIVSWRSYSPNCFCDNPHDTKKTWCRKLKFSWWPGMRIGARDCWGEDVMGLFHHRVGCMGCVLGIWWKPIHWNQWLDLLGDQFLDTSLILLLQNNGFLNSFHPFKTGDLWSSRYWFVIQLNWDESSMFSMCTCAHLCFRNTCVDTIIFFANSCACISTHLWVQIWCWCFTKRKLLPKKKTPPKKDVRPYFYIFDASPGIRFAGSIISNCPIVHSLKLT